MRKIICFLSLILLLCVSTVQAATFSVAKDSQKINEQLNVDNVVFVNNLKIKNLNILDSNNNKLLSLDAKARSNYIRKIVCKNPDKVFYEIKALGGAHGELGGYWLIGQHNGKWVVYVNLESLRSMGACFIFHCIESKGDSLLISTYNHKFPDDSIVAHADIELFWDYDAQWFGMRRVYED